MTTAHDPSIDLSTAQMLVRAHPVATRMGPAWPACVNRTSAVRTPTRNGQRQVSGPPLQIAAER